MIWIKKNVHVDGKVDFERFKQMAQNMSAKEFKENCLESKNFWHIVFEYLQCLEESFFDNSFIEEYNELPLRTTERIFVASFLTSSLKRVVCSEVHIIRHIITSCTEYYDSYIIQPDYRVDEFISEPSSYRHIDDLFYSGCFNDIVYYKYELVDTYFYTYHSIDVAIESANEDFINSLMKYGWFSCGNMSADRTTVDRVVKLFVSIW